jgi:hypothetical protein
MLTLLIFLLKYVNWFCAPGMAIGLSGRQFTQRNDSKSWTFQMEWRRNIVFVFWECESWLIALIMEIARTSETTVNFYQTTRRNIPKHSVFLNVFIHWITLVYEVQTFFKYRNMQVHNILGGGARSERLHTPCLLRNSVRVKEARFCLPPWIMNLLLTLLTQTLRMIKTTW